ncbi:hypothetical protein [Arthrobacter sp. StoSoilB20]|uniref:hypothetical protein n=1 Tax=Arthrobacter sp. StoSoilB20 TaxID=2830995 RepID=UPI001CC6CF4C|nr:hypothetical protein [Arthrobacter sp. StoSoilB20]BCW58571.1 hypothetical protein StoSoilB20_19180 [Arthrobacter sp. StoSoilB20]
MYFYLLLGRELAQRLDQRESAASWIGLTRELSSGLAVSGKADYEAPVDGVPESKLSIYGSHLTVLTFSEREAAEAADALITKRIAELAKQDDHCWDVRRRLLEQVDRFPPSPSRTDSIRPHAAMFQVSWKVPQDLQPSFSEWYEGHLRWHSDTFAALDARRLVPVAEPSQPSSYPYDVTAMYWFEQPQEVIDMCVDLVERGKRGWPDVAQWSARTLSDRSPFILISGD